MIEIRMKEGKQGWCGARGSPKDTGSEEFIQVNPWNLVLNILEAREKSKCAELHGAHFASNWQPPWAPGERNFPQHFSLRRRNHRGDYPRIAGPLRGQ